MTAVERAAADIGRLLPPGLQHVIERTDRAEFAPDRQQRCRHARIRVLGIMVDVDRRRRAIILTDGVAGRGIVVAAQIFRERRGLCCARRLDLAVDVLAQEHLRIGGDHALGQRRGLNQEKPPEIAGGEFLVGAGIHRRRRCDIDYGNARDRVGMVQRHAVRDPAAAVVAGHAKTPMAEAAHQRDLILGHAALGIGNMLLAALRLAAVAITAQIRRHDGEVFSEARGHLAPGDMGLRMAVQQQQRRPFTADRCADDDPVAECGIDQPEAIQERRRAQFRDNNLG